MQTTTSSGVRLNAAFLKSKHDAGLNYSEYLATDPRRAESWRKYEHVVALTPEQRRLVEGFTRPMKVLCVSGIWCGDCAVQGPMLEKIAQGNPRVVDLKWIDRDEHMDLSQQIQINAGERVPVAMFMAEDFEPVSMLGDRTLTRYRALAAKQLGSACPLPGAPVPQDELNATLQEWLDEFERVHLLLRLSARLREKHGD